MAYLPYTNDSGDTYVTNVYTETVNGVLIKDNLYIYVNGTTGSDATGDGTITKPFKTIQKGLDKMVEYVSPNIKWLYIAPGTYTENIEIPQELSGSIYLVGDIADANNVIVQASLASSPVFRVNCSGTIYFNGIKIQNATASHGILCENSEVFIFYTILFNNRAGIFSYNGGKVYFAGPGLPYPNSAIDGNNIVNSYGLRSEFDSVITSSQDITIENVYYGISCKYSSISLMGTYNISSKYSAFLIKDNSYFYLGLGTYNLEGSSNALTTVRGIVIEESQLDLSQVTVNFDTFYYGFYGLTGSKIMEAESIVQHYNYTDTIKPAYIEYDSIILSTTDLDTTIEYFESPVLFGLDSKYLQIGNEISELLVVSAHELDTFTHDSGVHEKGETVDDFDLNWSYNRNTDDPTSQELDNGIGVLAIPLRNYSIIGAGLTTDTTYTIDAIGDDTNPSSLTTTVYFRNKLYWGIYDGLITTDVEVLTNLTGEFETSRAVSKAFDASTGTPPNYLYYCYPKSWGVPTATYIGGFAFSDYVMTTIVGFTNSSGYSEDYYLIRTNPQYNSAGIVWQLV